MAEQDGKTDERREEERAQKKFKVVDRRRFDEHGDAREGAPKDEPARPAPTPPPAAAAPKPAEKPAPPKPTDPRAAQPPPGPKEPIEETALPFTSFLQSLAQQALMCLGMIPFPSGHRELQLDAARDTIDVLELLKVKTRGNLDAEETKLLDSLLYELRMTYVEVARRVAAAQAQPMPPPPGGRAGR